MIPLLPLETATVACTGRYGQAMMTPKGPVDGLHLLTAPYTGHTDRQTDTQANRQTDRQMDRQMERQMDRHTDARTYNMSRRVYFSHCQQDRLTDKTSTDRRQYEQKAVRTEGSTSRRQYEQKAVRIFVCTYVTVFAQVSHECPPSLYGDPLLPERDGGECGGQG